jgi:lipid-A-disaccharide synthase
MAKDFDLVLSIFPFERDWYAGRVPQLPVEFIGHPMIDRYKTVPREALQDSRVRKPPTVLLLPGSRPGELTQHLPVLLGALEKIRGEFPGIQARMVLPNEKLLEMAKQSGLGTGIRVQIGGLADALQQTDLALASTGTVTLECAYFGVPAVALYKTSWFTWQIAKRIVTVKYGAMPNLLADQELFPEFIQDAATPENIGRAAIELLRDAGRRQKIKVKLAEIVASLGLPGAANRAAKAVMETMGLWEEREAVSVNNQ